MEPKKDSSFEEIHSDLVVESKDAGAEALPETSVVMMDGDDDDVEVSKPSAAEAEGDRPLSNAELYPPGTFTDDRGNLKFVNLVVRNSCCFFWAVFVACIAITLLLVVTLRNEGNPFTNPENEYDINDLRSLQYDSLKLAQEDTEKARDAGRTTSVPRQSEAADITYWVFEAETSAGVFGSAESINAMKDAFDIFLDDSGFADQCLLKYEDDNTTSCDVPLTPLSMYYASSWDSDLVASVIDTFKVDGNIQRFNRFSLCFALGLYCDLITNVTDADEEFTRNLAANVSAITDSWDMKGELVDYKQATELASYLVQIPVYRGKVDFGYDKQFSVENPVSMFSRGIVFWGGPLGNQTKELTPEEKEDKEEDDADERKEFIVDNYLDEMDDEADTGKHKTVNSYYFMGALIVDVILDIVTRDGMLAQISLAFVFFWIRVNTGSWFLAAVGIFEIFMSLPIAWFLFSVVFRIKYFATLNSLAIFIVAAIGADDIFIFLDAYKQSGFRNPENLVDLETRMSWVYRRTGTAMAITSATTCCAFLCTLITPISSIQSFGIFAAFVILMDYVLVMTLFFAAVVIYHNKFEGRGWFGCCCTDCTETDPPPTVAAKAAVEAGEVNIGDDKVSNFFRTKVAGIIKTPSARLGLFAAFAVWIGIAVWQMSQIEAVKEAEQFLDEDHPLQKSVTILNNEFPTADDDLGLKVFYAFGLGEVDRSSVNLLLDPEDFGEPTFLPDFDFNAQCQTELVNWCDKFRTDPSYEGLIKRKAGVGLTYCFIEELAAYAIKGNLDDCDYVRQGLFKQEDNWQVDPSQLPDLMDGFLRETSCYDDDGQETIAVRYANEMGWDGEKMKYAALAVESEVLNPFSQDAESVTRKEYDQFVAISREINAAVSPYCTGPVIMTDLVQKFVFMNNQSIYVQTAIQSSILGVGIAFAVLLISTRVVHIAFFASLSIISVLVSVTGMMVILGWKLGSIESILIGIIAGFSVDYVVHLAHAYETAHGNTYERVTEAFGDMGISVLNGMITSVAASLPLFFCQLQFFAKFGTFLCLTIAFSWVFANFAFMSILAQLKIPIKKEGCRL